MAAKDWEKAYQVFGSAIDKKADYYEAWYGCICAMTENLTWINDSITKIHGEKGLQATIMNCLDCANSQQQKEVKSALHSLYNTLVQENADDMKKVRRLKQKNGIAVFVGLAFVVLCFALSFSMLANGSSGGTGLMLFVIASAIIIPIVGNNVFEKPFRQLQNKYSPSFREKLNVIKDAIE